MPVQHLQRQAGGGDDDVGLQLLPDVSLMPVSVKLSMWSVTTEARPP
jgi:hypothetical protein